jgi:hypothetical protein
VGWLGGIFGSVLLFPCLSVVCHFRADRNRRKSFLIGFPLLETALVAVVALLAILGLVYVMRGYS